MPTSIKAESKHRDARNPIVATFWKRDKFECIGTRNWQAQCVSVGRRLQLRAPILRMLHLPPHGPPRPKSQPGGHPRRRLHHPPSFLIGNYRGHRGDTPDHGMGTSVAGRKGERCRCQSLSKEWHDQRLPRLVGTG